MRYVTIAALLLGATASPAFAKNTNGQWDDSPYAAWYDRQYYSDPDGKRQMGGSCCQTADGRPYDGIYTLNKDGSVTLNGKPEINIPSKNVLDGSTVMFFDNTGAKIVRGGPNPTGHAIIFTSGDDLAHATIYCFIAGPLASLDQHVTAA